VAGRTWVTSCIAGVCWTAGVMSAITVGAPPAHGRVQIVVLDAQTMGAIKQKYANRHRYCQYVEQSKRCESNDRQKARLDYRFSLMTYMDIEITFSIVKPLFWGFSSNISAAERHELRTRSQQWLDRSRPRLAAAWAYAQAVSVCGETACRSDSGGHVGL